MTAPTPIRISWLALTLGLCMAACGPQPHDMDSPTFHLGPWPHSEGPCTAAPPPYGPGCGEAPGEIPVAAAARPEPMAEPEPPAPTPEPPAPEPTSPKPPTAAVVDEASAEIYDDLCAGCHGEPGEEPNVGPNLFTVTWDDEERAEALVVIRDGEQGDKVAMPAFGDELSEPEIAALVDWIAAQGAASSSSP